MEKAKRNIIKLLIILFTLFLIDGGRSLLLVGENRHILFTHNHSTDVEVPNQFHFSYLTFEENWYIPAISGLLCLNPDLIKFPSAFNIPSQEFLDSIWQPPKSV